MKKLCILFFAILTFAIPVLADEYMDYCDRVVNYIISALDLSEDSLSRYQIIMIAKITPEGKAKDVKVNLLNPSSTQNIPELEEEIKNLQLPVHNFKTMGVSKPIVITRRIVRQGAKGYIQETEYINALKASLTAGFHFHRPAVKLKAKVAYKVTRDGKLKSFHITSSSGNDNFDKAIEKHLEKRQKDTLIPLPKGYPNDTFTGYVFFASY